MIPYKKVLELGEEDYYDVHINLVNSIARLKLTPKEIEVLCAFMELKGDIVEDRFCSLGRKKVRDKLDLSDAGLSNYIKSLRLKKCLINVDDHIEIHPTLHPQGNEQTYMFKLILMQ